MHPRTHPGIRAHTLSLSYTYTQVFTNVGWTDAVYYQQKLRPLLTQLLREEARERAACAVDPPTFRQARDSTT